MFGIKKKQLQGKEITIQINGMHCTSCSLNIDGELEDLDGVINATTSYAKATSTVTFNESLVSETKIKDVITGLGYKIV